MAHKGYVARHIPGKRVRIRVPHKKNDQDFFEKVTTSLNNIPGVAASATPSTAGILVHYDGDFASLLLRAAEAGVADLIELELGGEPIAPVAERLLKQAGTIEQMLLEGTGGHLDGRSLVLLTLLVATGVQLVRGHVFGPALPLLWYAAETIRHYYAPNRLAIQAPNESADSRVPAAAPV